MFCPQCGNALADDAAFCDACGARVRAAAPVASPAQSGNAPAGRAAQPSRAAATQHAAPRKRSKKPLAIAAVAVLAVAVIGIGIAAGFGGLFGGPKECYVVSEITTYSIEEDDTRGTGQSVENGGYEFVRDERGAITQILMDGSCGPDSLNLATNEDGLAESASYLYNEDAVSASYGYSDVTDGLPASREQLLSNDSRQFDVLQDYEYDNDQLVTLSTNITSSYADTETTSTTVKDWTFDDAGNPVGMTYASYNSTYTRTFTFGTVDNLETLNVATSTESGKVDDQLSLPFERDSNGNISRFYTQGSSGQWQLGVEITWQKVEDPYPFVRACANSDLWLSLFGDAYTYVKSGGICLL